MAEDESDNGNALRASLPPDASERQQEQRDDVERDETGPENVAYMRPFESKRTRAGVLVGCSILQVPIWGR